MQESSMLLFQYIHGRFKGPETNFRSFLLKHLIRINQIRNNSENAMIVQLHSLSTKLFYTVLNSCRQRFATPKTKTRTPSTISYATKPIKNLLADKSNCWTKANARSPKQLHLYRVTLRSNTFQSLFLSSGGLFPSYCQINISFLFDCGFRRIRDLSRTEPMSQCGWYNATDNV